LITGTSTGGIIALGLAMETLAEEIARFYETGTGDTGTPYSIRGPHRIREGEWRGKKGQEEEKVSA